MMLKEAQRESSEMIILFVVVMANLRHTLMSVSVSSLDLLNVHGCQICLDLLAYGFMSLYVLDINNPVLYFGSALSLTLCSHFFN